MNEIFKAGLLVLLLIVLAHATRKMAGWTFKKIMDKKYGRDRYE